jgi:hydrogenase small subunit
MQRYTRRDVLRMGAFLAASLGLDAGLGAVLAEGVGKILNKSSRVLWLQGLSCSGCSVSLLNAESPDVLEVVTEVISLVYHSNLSAVQGEEAMRVIDRVTESKDYYLGFEGAVPSNMPEACVIGGRPLTTLLPSVLRNAKAIVAAGTCAAFGGVPAAEGNATGAVSLGEFMRQQSIPTENRLVNCPGCPMHPECLVGTIAYVIARGYPKIVPGLLTPEMFYKNSVHDECPRFHYMEKQIFAEKFGDDGCLFKLGCLGPLSHTACPRRQWNGGANWCIRAGAPCIGCTSEGFAKRRDFPFYRKGEQYHQVAYQEADRRGSQS